MSRMLTRSMLALIAISACACATTSNDKKDLIPAEVARYQEAVDQNPSSIPEGTQVIVSVTGDPRDIEAALNAQAQPVPQASQRDFTVDASTYEQFFSASPAMILSRMQLDPVRDGSALLGYRIVKFTNGAFEGVDLIENDVIVGINGSMPKTPDDYFAAWEDMKASQKATVDVQRSVERFTLTWTKQ